MSDAALLYPYQQRWLADDSRFKVGMFARQTGKAFTTTLELVLDSWNTPKTRDYRSLMDMSEAWGTAVIIQAMVFGNLDENAGSGVVFTAHPYRKVRRVALWGDYAPGDQGEDIVSGLVATYPISVEQAELDGRSVRQLVSLLRRLTVARLITSHDLGFLRQVSSRILVLLAGRIVAGGPTEEILSHT